MELIILSLAMAILFYIALRLFEIDIEDSISFSLIILLIGNFIAIFIPINGFDLDSLEYIETIDIVECVEDEENYIFWNEKEQYVIDVDNFQAIYVETKIHKTDGMVVKDLKDYETPFVKVYEIKGKKTEWNFAFFAEKYYYEIHIP